MIVNVYKKLKLLLHFNLDSMAKGFLHVITTYTTTCHPCALLMQITSFMCFIDANSMSFMCFLDASKKYHKKPKYYTNSGVFGKCTKLFVSCSNSKLIQLLSTSQIGDGENTYCTRVVTHIFELRFGRIWELLEDFLLECWEKLTKNNKNWISILGEIRGISRYYDSQTQKPEKQKQHQHQQKQ